MKTCSHCGQEKPLDEYYKHPNMKSGYLNKCKACTIENTAKHRARYKLDAEWVERERKKSRERYHRNGGWERVKLRLRNDPEGAALISAHAKRWAKKYPYKRKAMEAAQYVPKPPDKQRHHWSYRDEHHRDVLFMTMKDHATAHRFMIFDDERRQYRTLDGVLLDTKEAHMDYIKKIGVEVEDVYTP